jgi:succinate dehydrogenase / fumarate reductase, membrane anchor subunit
MERLMERQRMRSPLGRVMGLGSAKEGVKHWWMQRLSSIALIPLALWFVASDIGMLGAEHRAFVGWMSSPVVATLMVLTIGATFYHAQIGAQVVIEDYVHGEGAKLAAIVITKLAALALAVAGILAVLMIAIGG